MNEFLTEQTIKSILGDVPVIPANECPLKNQPKEKSKRGNYKKPRKSTLRQEYDFKLFETIPDIEFARKYNISRERARQLRSVYAPNTISLGKTELREKRLVVLNEKILEYIKENPKNIRLGDFKKIYPHNISDATEERFIEVAKENNITISFIMSKHDSNYHGFYCGEKGCNCDIYKLANAIRAHYHLREIKKPLRVVDFIANNFLEFYQNDESKYRKEFYNMIDHIEEVPTKEIIPE